MTATTKFKPWDFSHVFDLVESLSFTADSPSKSKHAREEVVAGNGDVRILENGIHTESIAAKDFATPSQGLGDFSRIFQYLGTPLSSPAPAPAVQTPKANGAATLNLAIREDYASDGATFFKASTKPAKAVQWDGQSTEEQITDAASDGSAAPETPTLTKSQRKKRNRRERRDKDADLFAERATKNAPTFVWESKAHGDARRTPAWEASAHVVTSPKQSCLREHKSHRKTITANAPDPLLEAANLAAQRLDAAKEANLKAFTNQGDVAASSSQTTATRLCSHPLPLTARNGTISAYDALHSQPPQHWLMSTPYGTSTTQFVPSTVQPPHNSAARPNCMQPSSIPNQNTAPPKHKHTIEPIVVRSGEDRHWALLIKLIRDFYEDRKHLISPMNLTNHNNDPKGIHVFVDASNIFIGFNEQLKRSRGIPPWIQVPSVDLSFDALALLIERRRPVAKRVLVGSTPQLPAFDKAKAVGYETSILEKVYKARELTERQIYFKELDRFSDRSKRAKAPPANNVATLNGGSGSGSGSGSETNAPQYAPARMIEQGVDEILHLKILESVVDADQPGTIVLATGDAAQAEYSEGFMAMVYRALKKGWTVELVSWSKNISAMYTRREWVETWGERFRIVTLDDYAEELLDM